MKRLTLLLAAFVIVAATLVGCAQAPKSANSSEAIDYAKTLEGVEAQAKFLLKEAEAFVNSKQYDEAIKAAKYVISTYESEADAAKKILEDAQAELKKLAEAKADELKAKMGLGK